MVVQNNMQAMNANRILNVTKHSQAKSTEKLSKGYKVKSASVDAVGLSISERIRLDLTSTNLDNVAENTASAESKVCDTNAAEEMVGYSRDSILAQADQSMLAQANQSNEKVLSLLSQES